MTALLVWVDLRAAGRVLFHANLGLDARLLMATALAPGVLAEILLHALQVNGA